MLEVHDFLKLWVLITIYLFTLGLSGMENAFHPKKHVVGSSLGFNLSQKYLWSKAAHQLSLTNLAKVGALCIEYNLFYSWS